MSHAILEQRFKHIGDLEHALAMLQWDEAAMMPPGGGPRRGEALAALEGLIHQQTADDAVGELVTRAAEEPNLNPWQQANVTAIERRWRRARALPTDLVIALSKATTACEQRWRTLRAQNDWAGIERPLSEVINLTQQRADCLAQASGLSPYDALIDEYEPGADRAMIEPIFAELRAALPPLIDEHIERQNARPAPLAPLGPVAERAQASLAHRLMRRVGFDFERGRLDTSHHPFCGGDPDDVRITTRYNTEDFLESMFAVLHETGHAMYEQGLPAEWRGQPVGTAGGMALHESQSLLVEMQMSRSPSFLKFASPLIRETLAGPAAGEPCWSDDNLLALATRVKRGFIRVDADELTYPMHVILRYELEKALLSGDLAVSDLPGAWDSQMAELLQLDTRGNFADGCMQDVHWFAGLIGYFPTYTLGAIIAAQLYHAASRALDGLDEQVAAGDFTAIVRWLRQHVHSRGRLSGTADIVQAATGTPVGTTAFLAHLERRYGDL